MRHIKHFQMLMKDHGTTTIKNKYCEDLTFLKMMLSKKLMDSIYGNFLMELVILIMKTKIQKDSIQFSEMFS